MVSALDISWQQLSPDRWERLRRLWRRLGDFSLLQRRQGYHLGGEEKKPPMPFTSQLGISSHARCWAGAQDGLTPEEPLISRPAEQASLLLPSPARYSVTVLLAHHVSVENTTASLGWCKPCICRLFRRHSWSSTPQLGR